MKEQVAARLAAHRARRIPSSGAPHVTPLAKPAPVPSRSARIAATVAERYANSPSYRAFLAAEAENAIRKAEAAAREADAAAEVASLNAQAVAEAQHELLAELEQWQLTPAAADATPRQSADAAYLSSAPAQPGRFGNRPLATEGLTVRIYDDPTRPAAPLPTPRRPRAYEPTDEAEGFALDEEIAFRQSPVFDEFGEAAAIPANLIEFPRQLIAARRARPRLAEGPLREQAGAAPDPAQLRIFEVEAAQIATAPSFQESGGAAEPEWSSILLAAHPVTISGAEASWGHPVHSSHSEPQPARLGRRVLASVFDATIVGIAFLGFVFTFARIFAAISARFYANTVLLQLSRPVMVQIAAIGTLFTVAVLALLYQLLFFTFSDATPGMRYARIALCTFSDDNPTRRVMRRRVFAAMIAACPLGIGILWAWLDTESLGWHDRISRTYQRSY